MHTSRATFPTEIKIGIYPEELKYCKENNGTFADLHRMKWRKRCLDALSCYYTRCKFIWRTVEHSNHKLYMTFQQCGNSNRLDLFIALQSNPSVLKLKK